MSTNAKVIELNTLHKEVLDFRAAVRPWYADKSAYLWGKYCVPVLNAIDYLSRKVTARKLDYRSHLRVVR